MWNKILALFGLGSQEESQPQQAQQAQQPQQAPHAQVMEPAQVNPSGANAGGLVDGLSDDEVAQRVEARMAQRIADVKSMDVEDYAVGIVAVSYGNIELKRYRTLLEISPTRAAADRAYVAQRTVDAIVRTYRTVLEPVGTNRADVTYVNIMGTIGDGVLSLRAENANDPVIPIIKEVVSLLARDNDELAQSIINDTYHEALWQKHAALAMESPEADDSEYTSGYYHEDDPAHAMMAAMRQVDSGAEELQPISGVSFHDYVSGSAKIHAGMPVSELCAKLGVERPQWDQAATEWQNRITQYPMTVGMEYANLMSKPHPVLDGDVQASPNAERLNSDIDFYIEVTAAMNAVGEVGLDAGGYLEEHYGVTVAETTSAGIKWMMDLNNAQTIMNNVEKRQAEIAKTLSVGGIADDIVF